jgi:preprotein translocase subunit SecG
MAATQLSFLTTLGVNFGGFLQGLLLVLFLAISVVMILVVLIQRPQGGGLSGAFGASADGAGQTALGVKTGDALTTATIVIFLAFIGLAIWLNFAVRPGPPPTEAQLTAAATEVETADADATEPGGADATAGDANGDDAESTADVELAGTDTADDDATPDGANDEDTNAGEEGEDGEAGASGDGGDGAGDAQGPEQP